MPRKPLILTILDGWGHSQLTHGNAIATAPVAPATYLGAVTRADDWTAAWTYGLRAGAQGEPLWFAAP